MVEYLCQVGDKKSQQLILNRNISVNNFVKSLEMIMTPPAPLLQSLRNLPMYPSGTNSPLSMSGLSLVSEINIKSGSQYSAIAANSAFLLALITKVHQLLSF